MSGKICIMKMPNWWVEKELISNHGDSRTAIQSGERMKPDITVTQYYIKTCNTVSEICELMTVQLLQWIPKTDLKPCGWDKCLREQ